MRPNSALRSAIMALAILPITTVNAQTITITAAPATTTNFMSELLSAAKSLLDSIYPQISGFATVTLPATVVIEGSTYRIPDIIFPTPTSTSSSSSSATSSSATTSNPITSATSALPAQTSATVDRGSPSATPSAHSNSGDRRLGIILGVVLGVVALALLFLLIFCIHRRKRRTGRWLKEKPPGDDEIETWRGDSTDGTHHRRPSWLGKSAEGGIGPWRDDSYATLTEREREPRLPAIAESGKSSDSLAGPEHHHGAEAAALMTAADGPYDRAATAASANPLRRSGASSTSPPAPDAMNRRSIGSMDDRPIAPVPDPYHSRAATPLVPDAFQRRRSPSSASSFSATITPQRTTSIPRKPVSSVLTPLRTGHNDDPFASPEDGPGPGPGPATPLVPVRSPDRWSRGSGGEMEGFDFGLLGQAGRRGSVGSWRRREWENPPRRW